jgi:hypothetical protein
MDGPPEIPAKTADALRCATTEFAFTDKSGGFVAANPGYRLELGPDIVPEPAVLHYLLHQALGFRDLGRFEKSAWEITFTYRGIQASVALQKFGLGLYFDRQAFPDASAAKVTGDDAIRDLVRGLRIVEERILREIADAQMRQGNVTFLNQAYRLREMHSYFRDGAMRSYEGEGRMQHTEDGEARIFVRETEGFYNTVAMVMAYFSWLEHALVLSHPFVSGAPSQASDVASFMRLGWREKFKDLFDLAGDSEASAAYRLLYSVAEDYRNPWAHGALDQRGGAIGFHLPGSGAVAMSLSAADFTPSLYVLPFDRRGFERADEALKAVDAFLHEHDRTRLPMRWIESGLDVAFDIESRIKYALALSTDELFEDLMDYTGHEWERHANMDY